jgi:hypothetical protein
LPTFSTISPNAPSRGSWARAFQGLVDIRLLAAGEILAEGLNQEVLVALLYLAIFL